MKLVNQTHDLLLPPPLLKQEARVTNNYTEKNANSRVTKTLEIFTK